MTTNTTDPITTIDYLREARKLIERGWTQGSSGRDINGAGCASFSPEAIEWCAVGALNVVNAVVRDDDFRCVIRAEDALNKAVQSIFPARAASVLRYNDLPGTTKADILLVFDTAIRMES